MGRASSQRAALGLTANSLNTGPYCKARQRLPLGLIQSCTREVATKVESSVTSHWRGRTIKLIDGTTDWDSRWRVSSASSRWPAVWYTTGR